MKEAYGGDEKTKKSADKAEKAKNEDMRYSENWSHSKGPSSLLNQSNQVKPINNCP